MTMLTNEACAQSAANKKQTGAPTLNIPGELWGRMALLGVATLALGGCSWKSLDGQGLGGAELSSIFGDASTTRKPVSHAAVPALPERNPLRSKSRTPDPQGPGAHKHQNLLDFLDPTN